MIACAAQHAVSGSRTELPHDVWNQMVDEFERER